MGACDGRMGRSTTEKKRTEGNIPTNCGVGPWSAAAHGEAETPVHILYLFSATLLFYLILGCVGQGLEENSSNFIIFFFIYIIFFLNSRFSS